MKIIDPNIEEYTLENLNEMAKIYFDHEIAIIERERNKSNDYYTKGAGKWCFGKFQKNEPQINASDTSGASSTSDASGKSGTSDISGESGTIETIAPATIDLLL
ncbi:unnamed protein product [Aphis gossypii]|uniref:Uncharacterized protein n=2 Tax=Aphis gossypii TaxID=80765 RepID=A0A9P0JF54_APHGO|nr:unnamed protein product [Aphis gossypii]